MFDRLNPKQNFFELEQDILTWWKENKILEKSIEQRPEDKVYTFYDGPITANGEPHHGHMITFSMKDIIPRYWTMRGYRVNRSLGWDCQGIPVEYEVEKKLGFKEKKDIEEYGIAKFNELCRQSVLEHKHKIIELEELTGRLTNDEEEYSTMDAAYIESIWWSLKELYEKDLLYEGFKVVPYSTRAGTTLSNAEVALGGYKPIVDPAITVEFPLEEDENVRILAWTTTPWTMPSNLGLAVNTEIVYVKAKHTNGKVYVLAKDLLKKVFGEENSEIEVLEEFTGEMLVGKTYLPPFDFFKGHKNAHKIFSGNEFVGAEDGTGIVHLAPYGAEDNEVFKREGIESFDVLDDQGDFTEQVEPYKGQHYKDANEQIMKDLQKSDRLFKHEDYTHDMPMCWRTDTPLIYKPITSWYIGVSQLRDRLVELNNTINWVPAHVKEGRFGNWLAEIKDWGISRSRYWGTPLPIWKSESGKTKLIGSFEELEKLSGKKLDDPHRPYVDEIEFEFEGEKYTRIPDVLDVWYDSGAMPFARFHYPFENKEKFEAKFPAQYISESVDQTRGWFYSLHAVATTLFDSVAYENVVMSGFVLDDNGVKLSKSKKNYTAPKPMIENFGADTIRLNFFSTPISAGEDTTVSEKTLKIQKQESIIPLWNILSYFVTYANMHDWKPRDELAYNERNITTDAHPWDHIPFGDMDEEMDAWMIAKLQNTIKTVSENMSEYKIPKATKALKDLISETSKWYIRNSRDRFINGEQRALDVLYYVLVEIAKLSAPFIPFLSEFIYKTLVANALEGQKESVHLTDYPGHDQKFLQNYSALLGEMEIVRKITELGHSLRVANGQKVRQPLSELIVSSFNDIVPEPLDWMRDLLKRELNVKQVTTKAELSETEFVKVSEDPANQLFVGLNIEISKELKQEGILRELNRGIQALRKKKGLKLGDKIKIHYYVTSKDIEEVINEFRDQLITSVSASEMTATDSQEGEELSVEGEKLYIQIEE